MAVNVNGGELQSCGQDPVTGFYRDGCCNTGADDFGVHTVCAEVTEKFLKFSEKHWLCQCCAKLIDNVGKVRALPALFWTF